MYTLGTHSPYVHLLRASVVLRYPFNYTTHTSLTNVMHPLHHPSCCTPVSHLLLYVFPYAHLLRLSGGYYVAKAGSQKSSAFLRARFTFILRAHASTQLQLVPLYHPPGRKLHRTCPQPFAGGGEPSARTAAQSPATARLRRPRADRPASTWGMI